MERNNVPHRSSLAKYLARYPVKVTLVLPPSYLRPLPLEMLAGDLYQLSAMLTKNVSQKLTT